jgi:hypothetical protein
MTEVGRVVPTIGQRPEYLSLALKSIRQAGNAYVLLVGNKGFDAQPLKAAELIDQYLDEQDPALASKINFGFRSLPEDIKYINWLSDDDLLTPAALDIALMRIKQPDQPVLVFGACEYIDTKGNGIFVNRSGAWAVPLLRFGPQLLPQPGALYRRDAFEKIGGLSQSLSWAFDFELFLSLSETGKVAFVDQVLAQFRWHSGSLSVSKRADSVREASQVRISHLPKVLKLVSFLWEYPVRIATYLAGIPVSRVARKRL